METITNKELKELVKLESVELTDGNDNLIDLFIGHQERFCLMFNGKVILSVKGWKSITNKLIGLEGLRISEPEEIQVVW